MKRQRLSPEQAFAAMSIFLDRHRDRTDGGNLAALLGDIQINERDGRPFDPAAWSDWLDAVEEALHRSEELVVERR
ncbi:MAG TPA: hypothetical protein VHW66_23870 [Stellaceae bacterium]|jgi:hypothetical protein|nr:hypothetical protein [Stellaceae bacterium]